MRHLCRWRLVISICQGAHRCEVRRGHVGARCWCGGVLKTLFSLLPVFPVFMRPRTQIRKSKVVTKKLFLAVAAFTRGSPQSAACFARPPADETTLRRAELFCVVCGYLTTRALAAKPIRHLSTNQPPQHHPPTHPPTHPRTHPPTDSDHGTT
jgi:hypothetical protein